MTWTVPKRCSSAAIWASTECRLRADCFPELVKVARSSAVPYPALAGGGVLVATAAPTTTAATATMTRSRMSSCWRHSRLKRRQAHRIMARRAGTPPVVGSGADPVTGRSRTPTLIGSGGRRGVASGLSTGSVWSTTLPSRRKTTRSAHEASWASWVTTTAAMPRRQAARIRRMTASALVESSAPEGSSARSSWRLPTTARAMATRWRSPPDSCRGSATPGPSARNSRATRAPPPGPCGPRRRRARGAGTRSPPH
jgi:hypothetical protein